MISPRTAPRWTPHDARGMVRSAQTAEFNRDRSMTRPARTTPAALLVTLLLSVPATLAAQAPMNLDRLVDRRGVYLHPETLEAYSGPVVAMWDASIVRLRGTLENGRWDGVRETFYLDGQLETRETYRDGVLHGPFESYFRTGRPSDKGTYDEGQLEGPYEAYWSRTQGDIHAAHMNAAGSQAGDGDHAGHAGMDMPMPGDLMERGTWHDGRPCGDWYRFLPRNSQGFRSGQNVQYPACPADNR